MVGVAPALSTSTDGRTSRSTDSRATTVTLALRATSASTTPRPSPRLPPVTRTRFCSRVCMTPPLANSIDQADAPVWKLLNLPEFEPTTTFSSRKECLSFTRDQRINDKTEFIHQPGIDQARRNSSTADEINIFAGLLLEGSDFVESPEEARVGPLSRSQGPR